MTSTLNSLILVFAALFPIVNPPGTALLFLAMTRQGSHEDRAWLAKRIALFGFLIITASLYFGAYMLEVFGISVPVLRVAGGIVVTLTGWKLLNAPRDDEVVERAGGRVDVRAMAFYPLTLPLTTGPGTIAVTIALGAGKPSQPGFFAFFFSALIATMLICAMIYVCYRFADRVETTLGASASDAISRLFAFILMCIGIEIIWSGLSVLLAGVLRA
jgi:multiple antibiotic resistance protein